MRHENEILRLDLTKEGREARKSQSTGAAADIGRLQQQAAMYIKKIETERAKIEELDRMIAKYQERIIEQKARLGGVNAAQINNQLIQKQIKVLENRMDKCLMKFNETMAQNKVLRQRIDEYRRERVVFDGIYKKLERELHEKKKEMAAIIEDSKNAYQARDKSQSEMVALQQHAEKERTDFEMEFKELGELIKQQHIMLEQIRLKQFERTADRPLLTAGSPSNHNATLNDTAMGDDKNLIAFQGTESWNNAAGTKTDHHHHHHSKNRHNTHANVQALSQEKIHSHEDALNKIQEATGIYDINELVTRFLEAEEQNFSLFNYVNDINSEIERLEHSITDMRNQIEKYRGQGASTDTQRKKALRSLEDKLQRTDRKAEEYENRHNKALKTITQLKNGIHSIFTRIGAASTSVEEMLGNQGVTESNMMQYLGIIEQRTSEILQAYAASQVGLPPEQSLQLPNVTITNDSATKIAIVPPSYDDVNSDEEEDENGGENEALDERPLTRQELDKRNLKEFARKSNNGASGLMRAIVGNQ
jgi:coiled-coil domain-containing protein 63/114